MAVPAVKNFQSGLVGKNVEGLLFPGGGAGVRMTGAQHTVQIWLQYLNMCDVFIYNGVNGNDYTFHY